MGGVETHCEQIYPRIFDLLEDADITVLARSPYVKAKKYTFKGISVVSLWAVRNKYLETILHTMYALVFARLRLKCDIVHIHGIGPAVTIPLARALGMRVIFTHHGEDYRRKKWNRLGAAVLRAGEALSL